MHSVGSAGSVLPALQTEHYTRTHDTWKLLVRERVGLEATRFLTVAVRQTPDF